MENLRKRVPFKFSAQDRHDEDNIVMDDQEQEELISTLRENVAQKNKIYLSILQAFAGISCLLHVVFFFGLTLLNEPPIALARLFALVQVLLHADLLLFLTPTLDSPIHRLSRDLPHLPMPASWTLGLASLAPFVSVMSEKSWQQTGRWSATLFVLLVVSTVLHWMKEGEQSIDELERLKYNAKGA
ncbi:hypothetical protein DFH11DRAFT_1329377 [Phellopilus nigrolimitatus]|nr:hypothetical protein DFH11DRAFT_1329377 [Phellopilus nigrolimitatus]